MKKLLVTGSCGLIGSAVVEHFHELGWEILGIDNNGRREFFGEEASTSYMVEKLHKLANYHHSYVDITARYFLIDVIMDFKPDAIVHTAAQPSHDLAAKIPYRDFDVNANGTFNMLEATRLYRTDIPFVHFSTSKVYGDSPNLLHMYENDTRYEYLEVEGRGINENQTIDQSLHSLFGASKVAADVCVQEYGRYFGMSTVCLRPGCLTGPQHAGVELHGFLNYLVKCNVQEKEYTVFGYKGKQVRDNIHSYDIATFVEQFIDSPRSGEVYNIGGGYDNSCSILEAFHLTEQITGKKMKWKYEEKPRIGDHICYYGDLTKTKSHYPNWKLTKSLTNIITETYERYGNNSSH